MRKRPKSKARYRPTLRDRSSSDFLYQGRHASEMARKWNERFEVQKVGSKTLELKITHIFVDQETSLMWALIRLERSGADIDDTVKLLNDSSFLGNSDWRLPTLTEAMTIKTPVTFGESEHLCVAPKLLGIFAWRFHFWTSTFKKRRRVKVNYHGGFYETLDEPWRDDPIEAWGVAIVRDHRQGQKGLLKKLFGF